MIPVNWHMSLYIPGHAFLHLLATIFFLSPVGGTLIASGKMSDQQCENGLRIILC